MTGAQIAQAPSGPARRLLRSSPNPAQASASRWPWSAQRAAARTYIKMAREVWMSWEQVGEALGVAWLARARGSSLAEAAFE
jgi:hypothetical protein